MARFIIKALIDGPEETETVMEVHEGEDNFRATHKLVEKYGKRLLHLFYCHAIYNPADDKEPLK